MSTTAPQGTPDQQPTPRIPRPAGILLLSAWLVCYGIAGAALSLRETVRRISDGDPLALAFPLIWLVLGSLYAVVGVGLFRGRRRAHRATLALMIFSMIFGALAAMFSESIDRGFSLLLIILITYYLTTPEVYKYFGQE